MGGTRTAHKNISRTPGWLVALAGCVLATPTLAQSADPEGQPAPPAQSAPPRSSPPASSPPSNPPPTVAPPPVPVRPGTPTPANPGTPSNPGTGPGRPNGPRPIAPAPDAEGGERPVIISPGRPSRPYNPNNPGRPNPPTTIDGAPFQPARPIIDPGLNPNPPTGRPNAPMPIGSTPDGRPRVPLPVPRPDPGERWSWRLTVNGLTWDSTGARPDGRPCPPHGWGGSGGWTDWHGHWGGLVAATPDSPYWWRRYNNVRNSKNNWWYGSFDPWDCRATGRRYSWWFCGPNFWVWRHFGSGSWTNWNGYYRYRNAAFIDGAFFAPAIDSSLLPGTLSTPTAQIPGVPTPGSAPITLASERPDYDLAIESFAARKYRDAYSSLRRHLRAEPTDAQAMRLLALTLAQQGKLSDAAAMTRMAYRTNPNLAAYPFDPVELGFTEATLRRLANTCVTYAHRVDSASAFLLASTVVQAEWREDVAQRLLDRAGDKGLDRDIRDALDAALKNPQR